MKLATEQLRDAIATGKVNKNLFSGQQLQKIMDGSPRIPDLTWHHHQDFGRMQLVPTNVHQIIGHVGGFEMWQ